MKIRARIKEIPGQENYLKEREIIASECGDIRLKVGTWRTLVSASVPFPTCFGDDGKIPENYEGIRASAASLKNLTNHKLVEWEKIDEPTAPVVKKPPRRIHP